MDMITVLVVTVAAILSITPVIIISITTPGTRTTTNQTITNQTTTNHARYYKIVDSSGEFATVEVYGQNLTVRERKWLETEEEGIFNTSFQQNGNDILTSWNGVEIKGNIWRNGVLIEVTSPSDLAATQILEINKAEAQELNEKDPVEAPPSPYKARPDNLGKFVFISGPPGAGKSSIA